MVIVSFTSRIATFLGYDAELEMPVYTVDYEDRLKVLKIFSLERRRERYIFCIYTKSSYSWYRILVLKLVTTREPS